MLRTLGSSSDKTGDHYFFNVLKNLDLAHANSHYF